MIEVVTFEDATVEKLTEAEVIMTIGWGDLQAPRVLLGRERFAVAAGNKEIAAEMPIVRVKIESDEQFAELKGRVKEAKGELDPYEDK
ncbi:MAG: hypothetical protein CMJ64_19850 [Planctomycetaceae bacterium]|nr:hypothetical protein [Planctomycetaceae bacterium]